MMINMKRNKKAEKCYVRKEKKKLPP